MEKKALAYREAFKFMHSDEQNGSFEDIFITTVYSFF